MYLNIFYPMLAMVLLTVLVGVITLYARIEAVRRGQMSAKYFKTFSHGEPTELVLKTGRHFMNLFEVPVLFYVAGSVVLALKIEHEWISCWAWLFVLARVLHAFFHIGPNKIYPRMASFFLGYFAVLALWITLLMAVLRLQPLA